MSIDIHISRGVNRVYFARCRYAYARKYGYVGPRRKSKYAAMLDMIREFSKQDYIEAEVCFSSDWYSPNIILKLVRR